MALTRSLLTPFSLSQMAEQGGRGGGLLLFRSSSSRTCGGKSAFNSILRGGGGFGRPSSKKAFSAQVARAESEQEGGGQMERQQQQQPEQRVSMTSSPMRGLLSRMLSDPYGGKRYARFVLFFCLLFVFFFFLARISRKMRSFDFRYKNWRERYESKIFSFIFLE